MASSRKGRWLAALTMAAVTSAPVLLLWSLLRAPVVIALPVLVGALLLGAWGGWWLGGRGASRPGTGRPPVPGSAGDFFVLQMLAEAAGLVGELDPLVAQLTRQVGELAQVERVVFILCPQDGESGWAVAGEAGRVGQRGTGVAGAMGQRKR